MRQHPARPPNPQSSPASPVKAPAPCTKRSEPNTCLSIQQRSCKQCLHPSSLGWAANAAWPTASFPCSHPHECYVEVFAGGGALYFLRPQPAPVEVLNDINGDLVTLYRVVQNHLEEFVRQFKWALSSRQIFEWQKMTRPETLTDIQRAARFFYLQHHAFGGKVSGQSFGTATTAPAINLLRIE